jgi:hypothetical protein
VGGAKGDRIKRVAGTERGASNAGEAGRIERVGWLGPTRGGAIKAESRAWSEGGRREQKVREQEFEPRAERGKRRRHREWKSCHKMLFGPKMLCNALRMLQQGFTLRTAPPANQPWKGEMGR